eukprot:m.65389 g.65389  ORF g.65389 m.65389 type:complete len:1455 (+) comp8151_c1_seq1:983-5347(+)
MKECSVNSKKMPPSLTPSPLSPGLSTSQHTSITERVLTSLRIPAKRLHGEEEDVILTEFVKQINHFSLFETNGMYRKILFSLVKNRIFVFTPSEDIVIAAAANISHTEVAVDPKLEMKKNVKKNQRNKKIKKEKEDKKHWKNADDSDVDEDEDDIDVVDGEEDCCEEANDEGKGDMMGYSLPTSNKRLLLMDPIKWYRYLCCLRILLRDDELNSYLATAYAERLHVEIAFLLKHFKDELAYVGFHCEIRVFVELVAIVAKLCNVPENITSLFNARVDEVIIPFIGHRNTEIVRACVHCTLALISDNSKEHKEALVDTSITSMCLQSLELENIQISLRTSIMRLLLQLSTEPKSREDLIVFEGLKVFQSVLQEENIILRTLVVQCIESLCLDHDAEIRHAGIIPQFLQLLNHYVEVQEDEDIAQGRSFVANLVGEKGPRAQAETAAFLKELQQAQRLETSSEESAPSISRPTLSRHKNRTASEKGDGLIKIDILDSTIMDLAPSSDTSASVENHAALKCAVMASLTSLCRQEMNAVKVQEYNGIYIIGKTLASPLGVMEHDASPSTSCTRNPSSIASLFTRPLASRPNTPGNRRLSAALSQTGLSTTLEATRRVQAYAMRLLRFLFSVEQNRRYFKRLFPPDLFAWFIDVGHYQYQLSSYRTLVKHLYRLTSSAIRRLKSAVEDTNIHTQPKRHVREYGLLEKLGEGSFGAVYRAISPNGETVAVKEIPLQNPLVFGDTDADRAKALKTIQNEVSMIKGGLQHPNVVRYDTSFVMDQTLFIIMEMVDGASLQDHFNAFVEKHKTIEETRIWRIFVQISNGLRYIHNEKHVVHRDLTPSNVMLGWYDKVTIVDFGLARQRKTGNTLMESSVGTITYSCPEIVTHQKYNEKADIWSLGCLLYQMATLRPPFFTNNLLSLARRIVEGVYDKIEEDRSEMLRDTVSLCLTPDPSLRPNIDEVCQSIGPAIMKEYDDVIIMFEQKSMMYEKERRLKRKYREELKEKERQINNLLEGYNNSADSDDDIDFAQYGAETYKGDDLDEEDDDDLDELDDNDNEGRVMKTKVKKLKRQISTIENSTKVIMPREFSDAIGDMDVFSPNATDKEYLARRLQSDATFEKEERSKSDLEDERAPFSPAQSPSRHSRRLPTTIISSSTANSALSKDMVDPRRGRQGRATVSCGITVGNEETQPQQQPQPRSPSSVPTTPTARDKDGVTTPRVRSGRQRPQSGSNRQLRLPLEKLKRVTDPALLLFNQLKKVMFICEQTPDLQSNPSRHVVLKFKQMLFGPNISSETMKSHLKFLSQASPTPINMDFGVVAMRAREEVRFSGHDNSTSTLASIQQVTHHISLDSIGKEETTSQHDKLERRNARSTASISLLEEGRVTVDDYNAQNTLTFYDLHQIVENELAKLNYYKNTCQTAAATKNGRKKTSTGSASHFEEPTIDIQQQRNNNKFASTK